MVGQYIAGGPCSPGSPARRPQRAQRPRLMGIGAEDILASRVFEDDDSESENGSGDSDSDSDDQPDKKDVE